MWPDLGSSDPWNGAPCLLLVVTLRSTRAPSGRAPLIETGERCVGVDGHLWIDGSGRGAVDPPGGVSRLRYTPPDKHHVVGPYPDRDATRCPATMPRHDPTSGGSGIRTHGALASTTVFETVRFGHSRIPPRVTLLAIPGTPRLALAFERCTQPLRRSVKNEVSRAAHSSASTPAVTGTSWFSLGSTKRLYREPTAPALGSAAP